MNPVTGEKLIEIGGQKCVLKFTWKALAEIEAKFGENPNLFNAGVLSKVAAAGLRDRQPEMTAEKIMEISPPLVPFAHAIQTAMQWAYFGAESIPEASKEVKKNLPTDGLLARIRQRFRTAFRRSSSGP